MVKLKVCKYLATLEVLSNLETFRGRDIFIGKLLRKNSFFHYIVCSCIYKQENCSSCGKEAARGVLRKRCSENFQQIYNRIPMPKCDFNKSHFGMGVIL